MPAQPALSTGVSKLVRRLPAVPAWLTFVLGLLVTATMGMLLLQRNRRPAEEPGVKMLAVLPFKNMGAAGDQYFADGLTEEITSRLSAVPKVGVVSRTSADQYKGTTKSLKQIGQELGVGYILEGSVRWEKSPDGKTSRVRVTPQLIRVSDDRHLWAERYDAELADVFQVQSGIAERVIGSMGVTLNPPQQRALQDRPTSNSDAYDLYLRGNDYFNRGNDRDNLRIAGQMYRRATELDSNFAPAWAKLSIAHSGDFWFFYDRSEAALTKAKTAADRALRLRPDLPDPHEALGFYYYWGKLDYHRALQEFGFARERLPGKGDLIYAIAAVQRRQGQWAEAESNFERAAQLDPRSPVIIYNQGETYRLLRKYDLALHTFEKSASITPDVPFTQWAIVETVVASGGSIEEARRRLNEALEKAGFMRIARSVTGTGSVSQFAIAPGFLLTADPAHQSQVERLALPEFADSAGYYHLKAELYRARKQARLEAAYLDSARAVLESQVRAQPEEASFHSHLGLTYAYLNRKTDAVREGETAVRLLPVSREAYRGANLMTALALIYATVGRQGDAVDRLQYLLSIPAQITRPLLRADPRWAPLRGDPRFERLVAGK
jgi:serine/threonine-protein kinase